ncbi:MAG TPA: DUF4350 domain-containing protein [Phenylobacterium sp.]|nr:DUF4350 domain-containing protein [Phenylobacterium sp.]
MRALALALALAAAAAGHPAVAQQQVVDPDYRPKVERPAYAGDGPVVVIDEAHRNFHTADGRYAPFAALLRADGLTVRPGKVAFDDTSLVGVGLLVIANAGSAGAEDTSTPAFTEAETAAVERWVSAGGALLLIADHAPFGRAAEGLAARFGVGMGKGWAFTRNARGDGLTSQLEFSRADGALADHPITRGRDAGERVDRVKTFTGQSLTGPPGAAALLQLPDPAWEAPNRDRLDAANAALRSAGKGTPSLKGIAEPVAGRAQGLALEHGRGRVVVLGEAAMFSAQKVEFEGDRPDMRMGMNVKGNDNAQLALNVIHWLTRKLP